MGSEFGGPGVASSLICSTPPFPTRGPLLSRWSAMLRIEQPADPCRVDELRDAGRLLAAGCFSFIGDIMMRVAGSTPVVL